MNTSNIATAINAEHEKVERARREGTQHAGEAGRLLIEARATVPHGGWDGWIREHCSFSPRTAQLYMKLHRAMAEDPQRVAGLSSRDAARLIAGEQRPRPKSDTDLRARAGLLIEAWLEAGAATKAAFAREIHERGDINAEQFAHLTRAANDENAAEQVVSTIFRHCGAEGLRRLGAALNAGATPQMIANALRAGVARRKGALA